MRNKKYRLVTSWKSIESQIRGTPMTFMGQRIKQWPRVAKALTLFWLLIEGSSLYALQRDCSKEFKRWWGVIRTLDLHTLLSALDSAGREIIDSADRSHAGLLDYDTFKQYLSLEYPFIGAVLGPVKRIIAGALGMNPVCFRISLSVCWFLKKLCLQSEALHDKSRREYLELEESMRGPVTDLERQILSTWYPRECFPHICRLSSPHHGDGSTADAGCDIMRKYSSLSTDRLLHYVCVQSGLKEWSGKTLDRTSKQVFVPKSYKAERGISMEPAALMWYQEGFNDGINKFIKNPYPIFKKHPLARRFDPENQESNRLLARWGSAVDCIYGDFATIDLSSASDLVTLEHIKAWYKGTGLYTILIGTRSTHTNLDGQRIKLKKFAPMGSALNFRVETDVFCAQVEAAILEAGGDPSSSRYRVYGDDIIVECKYYKAVISRLEANGFKVNRDKSFFRTGPHRFRESCGGFYLDGYDVTPLMISRKFPGYGVDDLSLWVDAMCDLANQCKDKPEANRVRQYLVHIMTSDMAPEYRPLASRDGRFGFYSPNPTNDHVRKVWNSDLQEVIYEHGGLAPQGAGDYDSDLFGHFLLYEWLRRAESRCIHLIPDEEDIIRAPRPQRSNRHNTRREDRGKGWARKSTPCFVIDV